MQRLGGRGTFRDMTLVRAITTLSLVFILYFCTSGGAFTTETLVQRGAGAGAADARPRAARLLAARGAASSASWRACSPKRAATTAGCSARSARSGRSRTAGSRGCTRWWTWRSIPKLFVTYLAYFVPALPPIGDLGRRARRHLGRDGAESRRRGARRTQLGRRGTVHHRRISRAVDRRARACDARAVAAVRRAGRAGASGLAVGLSIALWNYIGWDNASTVQGEVKDASRSYPRALAIALPLVDRRLSHSAARDARRDRLDDVARRRLAADRACCGRTAGPAARALDRRGGMVSALALFNALLLAYSRIPFVMATDGLLPAALARTDARHAAERGARSPRSATRCSCSCRSAASSSPTCCCTRSR